MNDQPRKFDIEIIDEAPPVPKAPPVGRNPDYLEGFLRKPSVEADPAAPGGDLYESIIAALRDIFDPEIPVNIYDLGLIYAVEVDEGHIIVTMTLTTPHCPVAESMPADVQAKVESVLGVATCEVNLVWDPPWDPAKMSDEAKLELGML